MSALNTNNHGGRGKAIDPISFEVIRHKLMAVTEEQATTLRAVSGSPVVTEVSDFNSGIYGPNGEIIVMGFHVLFHSAGLPYAIRSLIKHFSANPGFKPGDMFVLNDPYRGTVHQSDVMIIAPIIIDGKLMGWTGCCAHEMDIGGMNFGSLCPGATEIQQESMLLPGVKFVENDVIREDIWQMMMGMSRMPGLLGLDLNAMVAANRVAVRRFRELIDTYSEETVSSVMKAEIENTEQQFRDRLRSLPDGFFRANDFLEHDGHADRLYKIAMTVEKRGDRLFVDMTGSSPQAPGLINCTDAGLKGAVLAGVFPILAPDLRWNEGIANCIEITAPEGTIVNCRWPAPVSGATTNGMWAVVNAAQAALSRLMAYSKDSAREAVAVSKGSFNMFFVHGQHGDGRPFGTLILDSMAGGGGAYYDHDGLDPGIDFPIPKPRIGNVENYEANSPYMYLYRTRVCDSGGPGRSRGGVGTGFAITPYDTASLDVSMISHSVNVPTSAGIMGGMEGSTNTAEFVDRQGQNTSPVGVVVNRETLSEAGGKVTKLPPKFPFFPMRAGSVTAVTFQGGGGYGDPIDRDPKFVVRDISNGLVSISAAFEIYGVAANATGFDEVKTRERRAAIRAKRLGATPKRSIPADQRHSSVCLHLGADQKFHCGCGQEFGPAQGQWKDAAHTRVVLPSERGPLVSVRTELELREHVCPGCGTLLESELALKGEPNLNTIQILNCA